MRFRNNRFLKATHFQFVGRTALLTNLTSTWQAATRSFLSRQSKSGRLEDVVNALMPVSTEIGAKMAKHMFQTIEAGVKSVGNELSAGGKPITAELILDALDKVLVDFGADGQPKWPTIVIHPSLSDRLKAEDARFGSEPALAQRFAETIERKREEWRAREASRVLVG